MIRVCVISPEPTPYRAPLFDRIAAEDDIELTVVYAAQTIGSREWSVPLHHRSTVLRGWLLPTRRLLYHDYPVTPQIWPLLTRERPDVVVIPGWSLFASQAAVAWCRAHRVPYLITSESHGIGSRPRWADAVKRLVLPGIVRPAAGFLVTGRMAAAFIQQYGADPARIRVFANSPDVATLMERADARRAQREEIRARFGFRPDEVGVVSVARLLPQKAPDVLVRAVKRAQELTDVRLRLLFVGGGPERENLERQASSLGVDAAFADHLEGSELVDAYLAGDVFALLSRREPWGVVVNEAAACGLPLVLSDQVGAAYDLVDANLNGAIVPVEDDEAPARVIARLAEDAELRATWGKRSKELVAGWSHAASAAAFVESVRLAVRREAR